MKPAAAGHPNEVPRRIVEPSIQPATTGTEAVPAAVFEVNGNPMCFEGANNYSVGFSARSIVDRLLDRMQAMHLPVLRLWAFRDQGALDGTVPSVAGDSAKQGVYFQYWDPIGKHPVYNDGPSGLQRLDYVLHAARERGIKVVLVLTNNWKDFGGMDQYLAWYQIPYHHLFYSDARVRGAFKDYISHLVNRRNSVDGTLYREDPAIFSWELANEPRCRNFTSFDNVEQGCRSTAPLTAWAAEMANHLKALDRNHLVAVGDEGFLAQGRQHWAYQGQEGADHEALLRIANIDYGTFHLYPDHWGTGIEFETNWINDHLALARKAGKPTVLEEYGTLVKRNANLQITWGWDRRKAAYSEWNDRVLSGGGAGALFWMLAGNQEDGSAIPDYDGFTVYRPGPTAHLLEAYAQRFSEQGLKYQARLPRTLKPSPFVRVRRIE